MSENDRPSVTVIVSAYNAEHTIERALRSCLHQPGLAKIAVVNDGSSDTTSTIISEFSDPTKKFEPFTFQTNKGPSACRNKALSMSETPWVCVLDADDFFLPNRIKKLLEFSEDFDFIADDMWRVHENNIDGPRELLLGKELRQPRVISFEEFVSSNVTDKSRPRGELGFIKPLMRRSFLDAHNIRYQEHMRLGEDYELYARALACGARMLLVSAQGYVSVIRENSLSGRHTEEDLRNLRDCDLVLAKLPNLSVKDQKALRAHYLSVDCRLQWRLLISAVKRRDFKASLATFLRPMPVPLYLVRQLFDQLMIRLKRKLT